MTICSHETHRDEMRAYFKQWKRRRKYWRTHKAKCKAINDKYRLSHPGQHNAAGARRRATKLNATPPWMDRATKTDIRRVYALASEMSKRDGVRYHPKSAARVAGPPGLSCYAVHYVEATMEPKIWEWRIVTDVDCLMPAWQSEWHETDATTWCRLRDEIKPGKTCRLEFRTRYADEAA